MFWFQHLPLRPLCYCALPSLKLFWRQTYLFLLRANVYWSLKLFVHQKANFYSLAFHPQSRWSCSCLVISGFKTFYRHARPQCTPKDVRLMLSPIWTCAKYALIRLARFNITRVNWWLSKTRQSD